MSNPFVRPSSRTFEARYEGRCGNDCGYMIEPGDDVLYDGDELVHLSCAPRSRRPQPKPCPNCFLVHAGECF